MATLVAEAPSAPSSNRRCGIGQRHIVALLAHLGLFVVYVLRVIVSVAVVPMAQEYGWSPNEKGWVLSAFFFGYITLQLGGGYLSVRYGPKLVLALGVLAPAILTALTPVVAGNFPLLIAVRVLTGVGEAVSYPALHSLMGAWSPLSERSQTVGFVWAGAYLGTTFAFPIAGALVSSSAGWPVVFYVSSAAGVLWLVPWWLFVSDRPQDDRRISEEERDLIVSSLPAAFDGTEPVPWAKIVGTPAIWGVVCGHVANNWLFYTLLTWLPDYLKYELGFDLEDSGGLAVLPYIGCFLGSTVSGRVADWLIHKRGWRVVTTRRFFQGVFEVLAGIALVLAGYTTNAAVAVALVTVSVSFVGVASAGGYAPNILDLAPYFGGIVLGFSNTLGTLPGIISPLLTGYIVTSDVRSPETVAEWRTVFWIGLSIAVVGNGMFVLLVKGEQMEGLQGPAGLAGGGSAVVALTERLVSEERDG